MTVISHPESFSPDTGRVVICRSASEFCVDHPVLARPRALYDDFDAWWVKVRKADRTCYTLEDLSGNVRGIAVIDPRGSEQVKLCTFCLVDGERGTGLGFLQAVCASLALSGFKVAYGTALPEQSAVHAFFRRAGFQVSPQHFLSKHLS